MTQCDSEICQTLGSNLLLIRLDTHFVPQHNVDVLVAHLNG